MKPEQATLLKKAIPFIVKAVDEENYIIRGVFSTGGEDRHGEIVDQTGWNLTEYMANPVVLFAHDHYIPAVAKCIELAFNSEGNLEGALQFAVEEDTSGLSETLFNLYSKQFMRAFSVGFENTKYEVDPQEDMVILRENTLFEISCVNVPANAMALAKSKGLDMKSVEEYENLHTQISKMSPEDIEKLGNHISSSLKNLVPKVLSADTTGRKIQPKVETPKVKGGKGYPTRILNKVVRQLLKEKRRNNRIHN